MKQIIISTAPVSALAAAGACAVMPAGARSRVFTPVVPLAAARVRGVDPVIPAARLRVPTPAAVTPVTARPLPMTRQDQSAQNLIMTAKHGYAPVQETIPSTKLGGFRGVPPRRKPGLDKI